MGQIEPYRSLTWDETFDDADNSIFEAASCVCGDAEGCDPFHHRIRPVLRGNRIRWVLTSDAEVMVEDDDDSEFDTADEAKAYCQTSENGWEALARREASEAAS